MKRSEILRKRSRLLEYKKALEKEKQQALSQCEMGAGTTMILTSHNLPRVVQIDSEIDLLEKECFELLVNAQQAKSA